MGRCLNLFLTAPLCIWSIARLCHTRRTCAKSVRPKSPFLERTLLMAKYFGLLLLLVTLFAVGCSGPKPATEEESSAGMENIEDMGDSPDVPAK